jgi:hypothetical protein
MRTESLHAIERGGRFKGLRERLGHERGSRIQLTALLFRNGDEVPRAGPFPNHISPLNSTFIRSG